MEYKAKYIDENKWRVELEELTQEYERMLAFIEQELKTAPEGRLIVHPSKKGTEYYIVDEGGRRYLSKKDMGMVRALATKSYYLEMRSVLEKQKALFHRILKRSTRIVPKNIYNKMTSERRSLVKPLDSTLVEYAHLWEGESYETKGFQEGDPEHYAKNGLRVRSKSEETIVNLLLDYEVSFRYECKMYLKGLGEIHPDFIVLNKRTGEEFIWEHFGKVDDWKYANDMVKRVEAYHYNGYYEGENLIYTLESTKHPFGTRDAQKDHRTLSSLISLLVRQQESRRG